LNACSSGPIEKDETVMYRIPLLFFAPVSLVALAVFAPVRAHAQEQFQYENELLAKQRVFEDVGPGYRAIHQGPDGNYYILTAPANAVQIYDPSGKRVGQIPAQSAAKSAGLVYGESFDVDRDGHLAVSDRGANAVKIYSRSGALTATIPVAGPAAVALLPGGEVAVATPNTPQLITVFDLAGKMVREYGDREEIADRADVNDQVNLGNLAADETGNTYFAFAYLPEPTARKFDHFGYLTMEISLKTLEFQPAAQAARKAIARMPERGTPALHRIITAIGVDPQSQEVWLAIGTLLMRFNKDGQRLASFRTYMPGGARIEPSTILVERDRLLLGADPQGLYEFPKPEKLPE
jgi:hypothetical protein